jgi:hypothetical protein
MKWILIIVHIGMFDADRQVTIELETEEQCMLVKEQVDEMKGLKRTKCIKIK